MSVIRIHRRIESETLHLPELRPLLGKTVEILVTEQPEAHAADDAARWAAAQQAVREVTDYDLEAYREQREFDRRHGRAPELSSRTPG
jgi:hypothetical protein